MADLPAVNVRELRQNLSKYLRRVAAGETLHVAERGKPVAILGPLPRETSVLDRLIAEGKVIPPRIDFDSLGPPPNIPVEVPLSRLLEMDRSED